jgi:hypothetical protein
MKPVLVTVLFLSASLLAAQQQSQQQNAQPPQQQDNEKKAAPPPMTPAARLAAARTAFLRKSGGSESIPYDVVNDTLQGWGRFTLVDAPEKADIIIEVYIAEDSPTTISTSGRGGRYGSRPSASATKDVSISQIRLTVYDAKSKMGLWSGSARPKGALRKVDRENNEVEAAQQLVEKLHDQLEPPAKQ